MPSPSRISYLKPRMLAHSRLFFTLSTLFLLLFTLSHLHPSRSPSPLPRPSHPSPLSTPLLTNSTLHRLLISPVSKILLVSEPNRLIFCPIPKAANTNWKYLIRKWAHIPNYQDLPSAHNPLTSKLRYLSDYSPEEAFQILTSPNYFRFLFVRDPYTRLLSCYMDKFRNTNTEYTREEYRNFLAQLYSWRYARSQDIWNVPRPSFAEFVDELIKHEPHEMNPHWMPQTDYCGLGVVPYDFIGRMETLKKDIDYVFNKLGKETEHFPTHEEIGFPPSGASRELADEIYTLDLMFKVRVVYDDDFRLLGYV